MTSSRKAALLLNFYTRSATFNWDICADEANGLVVTVNFRIPPRNEAWHYIGLVIVEKVNGGRTTEQITRSVFFPVYNESIALTM